MNKRDFSSNLVVSYSYDRQEPDAQPSPPYGYLTCTLAYLRRNGCDCTDPYRLAGSISFIGQRDISESEEFTPRQYFCPANAASLFNGSYDDTWGISGINIDAGQLMLKYSHLHDPNLQGIVTIGQNFSELQINCKAPLPQLFYFVANPNDLASPRTTWLQFPSELSIYLCRTPQPVSWLDRISKIRRESCYAAISHRIYEPDCVQHLCHDLRGVHYILP